MFPTKEVNKIKRNTRASTTCEPAQLCNLKSHCRITKENLGLVNKLSFGRIRFKAKKPISNFVLVCYWGHSLIENGITAKNLCAASAQTRTELMTLKPVFGHHCIKQNFKHWFNKIPPYIYIHIFSLLYKEKAGKPERVPCYKLKSPLA